MLPLTGTLSHFANPRASSKNIYSKDQREIISVNKSLSAISDITTWPTYSETPLYSLIALSKDIGIDTLWYKDESKRFSLKSFKALGGAYAVACQLQKILEQRLGKRPRSNDLLSGKFKEDITDVVVSCATDGNHGRSVSWGAQMFGCGCVIYIHRAVSEARKQAMEEFGAEVIRIEGNYDESVRQADADAKKYDRIIISDTSYEGYMEIPKDISLGYTVMLYEIIKQLKGEIPTHVFVQGGVGGLASTVAGYFWDLWGEHRPRLIIVEPEQANCLQLSSKAGIPVTVEGNLDTLMAGLACGEISILGWKILFNGADDFMTLSEDAVAATMRLLAKGYKNDPAIEAGESAVPGLATAIIARQQPKLAKTLNLNEQSKILLIGTEGATDQELYNQLIG